MGYRIVVSMVCLCACEARSAEPNVWERLDKAVIAGRRWDVPLGYDPSAKSVVVLGGRSSFADYRKPRSYDVLGLTSTGEWENLFPPGKDWGPKVGACQAPAWRNESFHFKDLEGNVRPNWTVYGTFSLGQKYDYDPDTRAFYFYAGGKTFRYDPAARTWTDLEPATHPEKEMGGILLWSSMTYDRHQRRFILFGGGNVQSERGDPGTWTYTPKTNTWRRLELDQQPPQRANSRLVYDPDNKLVVLFGGDQLDQLLADTWVFDVVKESWRPIKPKRAPSPRGGHGLVWLPQAKKVLLVGGYTYTSATGYVEPLYQRLPMETWTFDPASERWDMLGRVEAKGAAPDGPANFFWSAAADDDDRVVVLGQTAAWSCRIDATRIDATGTAKHGVAPGTVTRRVGPHDPAWYREDVPPPDPAKVEADLKKLPANRWTLRPTPKLARPNMDWGSAVFAPELDLILRFSGGHSAYSGTAPQVYDVKTDRYSIPFAPEYPLEYVYSNDQANGEWSFKGNPWMTGHTYKSTGYDPHLKSLVFAPHEYTYFFDPKTGKWSRSPERNPYRADFYTVTVCATPKGAAVWAPRSKGGPGLWLLDAASRTWKPLPFEGETPGMSADHHGMAYDSRRDRLLLFSDVGKHKGNVLAYDLKSGKPSWLDPQGMDTAMTPCRETAYVPERDLVLIGGRVSGQGPAAPWLAYDCAANRWVGLELTGDDPLGKKAFNNSMGLMYDPQRRLIWAVGQNSHVHVLKLEK